MYVKIEGLVKCETTVVGLIIGKSASNLHKIRTEAGNGCFIRYEDQRLPNTHSRGYFYICANNHASVRYAIALLKQAEADAKMFLAKKQALADARKNRPQKKRGINQRKPMVRRQMDVNTTTEWPEPKILRLVPRKVQQQPLQKGTLVLKKN